MYKNLLIVHLLMAAGLSGQSAFSDELRAGGETAAAIVVAQAEPADDKAQPNTDGKKQAAEEEPDC